MRLTDLQKGDVFQLEGGHYETDYVSPSGRLVMCFVLNQAKAAQDTPVYARIPDPNDLTGDKFVTTVFSDLRFEREHLTAEERQYDEELKDLL